MVKSTIKTKRIYWVMLPVVLVILVLIIEYAGLTINISPSMRVGIYVKSGGTIVSGDIVSVCLIEPYKTFALERKYIGRGVRCTGTEPLIKEVIALPGDYVVLTDDYIVVNQNKYLFKTKYLDSHNRKLSVYPRGEYSHTIGFWVIGVNNQNSWDSRYFGPVGRGQILTKLKPIIVW